MQVKSSFIFGLLHTSVWLQVKHLYKSDSNILAQLGLTAPAPQHHVTYSPERHFRPICPTASEDPEEPLLCDEASHVQAAPSDRSSSYQRYDVGGVSFVPRYDVIDCCVRCC